MSEIALLSVDNSTGGSPITCAPSYTSPKLSQSDHLVPILSVSTRSANVSPACSRGLPTFFLRSSRWRAPFHANSPQTDFGINHSQPIRSKKRVILTDLCRGRRNPINLCGDKMLYLPRPAALLTWSLCAPIHPTTPKLRRINHTLRTWYPGTPVKYTSTHTPLPRAACRSRSTRRKREKLGSS